MIKISSWQRAIAFAALLLSACTPKFDWREVRGPDAPYSVLMPAKPATLTRTIPLGNLTAAMTMTAAEVDGVNYAVGSAELPDPAQARAALGAIESALVKNIKGVVFLRRMTPTPIGSGATARQAMAVLIEANGVASNAGSEPQSMLLLARFVAHERRVYQVVVLGRANAIAREQADTFLNSFKLN